ncbi:MAG TPA: insulinase family protein [Firmicutes bacterium]|nr:insulinase family protein [Bacillota bacterium]
MNFVQCNLGAGVRLHLCETDKFRSLTCKIFVQQDLEQRTASSTALIPLLLQRGSQQFPTTLQIARELEYLYAAELGADVLKLGERQILEFHFQMVDPSLLPDSDEHLERGLRTFWGIVTAPAGKNGRFEDTYFTQEKRTLRRELEGLINNKRAYALARFVELMCEDEPFGIHKYGDLASLDKLENERVYGHYQDLFRSHPMDIFLVGTNLDVIANLLAQLAAERHGPVVLNPPKRVSLQPPRYYEETAELQQAVLALGYRTNRSFLDDGYYALLVGNGILGGFPHSKLFINVREKASLAYYVGSSVEGTKGLLTISAGIDWDERDEAQTIIKQQVEQVQQGQISRQELEQTKAGLVNAMISMGDHPSGMIDRNLIGIIHGEMRSIDHVVDAIRAVQLEDVVEVMGDLVFDTTYILGPRREAGESNGTN